MGLGKRFNNAVKAFWGGDDFAASHWNGIPLPGTRLAISQIDDLLFELNRGGIGRRKLDTVEEVRRAFRDCSPLETILTEKGKAFIKGQIKVWDPSNPKADNKRVFKPWLDLFLKPNDRQSGRQFLLEAYKYWNKFGWCVIDPVFPALYNDRPASLRVIPNWMIEWEYNNGVYVTLPTAAWYVHDGRREALDVERLIICRNGASTELDERTGLPLSPIAVLYEEISNISAALEARGGMMKDRGAMGIISPRFNGPSGIAMPMDEKEMQRLQGTYERRGGGIGKNQKKLLVTEVPMEHTPLGFDAKQLGLHEEHIADLKAICNRMGYPYTALAEGFEGKYSNSTNGDRRFHDTTIDPESMDFMEQLSRGMGMYADGCEAYIDYSNVAALQVSQREKGVGEKAVADALQVQYDLGTITRNDIRERLGLEPVKLPEFNKYKWELNEANQTDPAQANAGGNQAGDQGA